MKELFGDLVKRLRIEKGMSVPELAEKSGFTAPQIRNIESNRNKPRVFNIQKLATALECDYNYLFSKLNEEEN